MKLPALLFLSGFLLAALSGSAQQRLNFNIPNCDPDTSTFVNGVSDQNDYFEVFPNPVADHLQLKFNNPPKSEKMALRVFTLNSKEVLVKNVTTSETISEDISSLSPGIYLLEVKCEAFLKRTKFIKL